MDIKKFLQRKARVKAKIGRHFGRPRLSVFRSNKFIYAQIIDDTKGLTLVSASSKDKSAQKLKTNLDKAVFVGELIAKKANGKKIKKAVFDKSGYKYHGQVKALADAARKGGLDF